MNCRFPCLLATVLASLTLAASAEPRFSFEATPGQLPKEIVPQRYAITIEPNPEKATLNGSERIAIEVRKPVRQIVLHSLGLTITKATLHAGQDYPLTPVTDEKEQTL